MQKIISEQKLEKLRKFYKGRHLDILELASRGKFEKSTYYSNLKNPKNKSVITELANFKGELEEKDRVERKELEAKI